jgi:hypothetical protein
MSSIGKSTAAQEIEINLDDFKKVEIDSGLKVEFTKSNQNKAKITGSSRETVIIRNKNGNLSIASTFLKMPEGDNTLVNIYYKQLEKLVAEQNSEVEFCTKVEQPFIKFRVSQGASINANLDVRNLNARVITGASLKIIGEAEIQVINIKTQGEFRGENLIGENVRVAMKGGGRAYIYSNKYVKAKVRAGGSLYIYGDPEKVVERSGIGATIEKIN